MGRKEGRKEVRGGWEVSNTVVIRRVWGCLTYMVEEVMERNELCREERRTMDGWMRLGDDDDDASDDDNIDCLDTNNVLC